MASRRNGEGLEKFKDPDEDFNIDDFRGIELPLALDPGGLVPRDPAELVGNTERGIDLQPPSSTPTTFSPQQPQPKFSLPQGVSVNEGLFSGVPEATRSMDTPAMSMEPSPTAAIRAQPAFATPVGPSVAQSSPGRGPQRRSASPSSLYAQGTSPSLSGRAGGLLEGGLGAAGGDEPSGPLQPTEMFQRLLQMFRQG